MFSDRTDAGEQLAAELAARGVEADVVLAIPRGGLPVARAVADRLGARLDVVVASKVGAPGNPELAVGAVAADGTFWPNEDVIAGLEVSEPYLEREREQEAAAAREKLRQYRGEERAPLPDVTGKRVVVVDDGVATGATARACLRAVRGAGADRVVLAVPVGAADSLAELEADADSVVAVEEPRAFGAVGQYYRNFAQVSDEEAIAVLEDARGE
jgi:predicted phosphoribosyltransferase